MSEKKKILIVEDDPLIIQLERDYLEASNFDVECVQDGNEALKMIMGNDYDFIILDVMLPGADGFKICRTIRAEGDVPVMMVTARKDDIDKIRGLGLGADDYMVKPFSPSEMVARVKAHLKTYERLKGTGSSKGISNQPEEHSIVIRALKIVKESRRVFVDDEEVNLVNKEYELLLFLAENPDIVFSKEILFDRVWGLEAIGDTSTITVHINRIRDKIERDSAEPEYIETVWGAGYRLKA